MGTAPTTVTDASELVEVSCPRTGCDHNHRIATIVIIIGLHIHESPWLLLQQTFVSGDSVALTPRCLHSHGKPSGERIAAERISTPGVLHPGINLSWKSNVIDAVCDMAGSRANVCLSSKEGEK